MKTGHSGFVFSLFNGIASILIFKYEPMKCNTQPWIVEKNQWNCSHRTLCRFISNCIRVKNVWTEMLERRQSKEIGIENIIAVLKTVSFVDFYFIVGTLYFLLFISIWNLYYDSSSKKTKVIVSLMSDFNGKTWTVK